MKGTKRRREIERERKTDREANDMQIKREVVRERKLT